MPNLNTEELAVLNNLKTQYLLSPHSTLFPDAVKNALDIIPNNQSNIGCNQAKSIYQALLNNTSFFQRLFAPALNEAYTKSKLLAFLNNSKQHECDVVFAQENFELIASNQNPSGLAKTFITLEKAQLLQTNRRVFSENGQNDIELLRINDMLTQEYLNVVNNNFIYVVTVLVILKRDNLLTKTNRSKLINFKYADFASFTLKNLGLTHRTIYIVNVDLELCALLVLTTIIAALTQSSILNLLGLMGTPFIFNLIVALSFTLTIFSYVLIKSILNVKKSLLTQDNFDTILNQPNLHTAVDALEVITQDNFDFLIRYENILLADTTTALWASVPPSTLTADHLKAIRTICENNNLDLPTRQSSFARYVNQTIVQLDLHPNDAQNTHIASIHYSVSETSNHALNPSRVFSHTKQNNPNDASIDKVALTPSI